MKKIFKRASAAVMALAVAATAVVFDVPGKLVAAAAVSRSASRGDYYIRGSILTINSDTGMMDWKKMALGTTQIASKRLKLVTVLLLSRKGHLASVKILRP